MAVAGRAKSGVHATGAPSGASLALELSIICIGANGAVFSSHAGPLVKIASLAGLTASFGAGCAGGQTIEAIESLGIHAIWAGRHAEIVIIVVA